MADVVGITGRKFHGKDTVAQIYVQDGYKQLRFADPLKEMLRAFYRTIELPAAEIERRIEGDLKETPCPHLCGKTPRFAMQTLGAEWGRDMIDEDLWVKTLQFRAANSDKAVVSDVRYMNEVETIKRLGGKVFRVDASARVPRGAWSDHSSEQVEKLSVDAVIDNNGAPEQLFQSVAKLNESVGLRSTRTQAPSKDSS